MKKSSPGYNMRVEYSKEESTGRIVGFFNDSGTVVMLEASVYQAMNMVSPFIGETADQFANLIVAPSLKSLIFTLIL